MRARYYSAGRLALFTLPSVFASPLNYQKVSETAPYGYPLITYVKTFYPVIEAKGVNVPKNDNTTSSASSASLVRPNADYVYSPMAVDLSHDDVVVTIPDINDGRSYVYPFYDLYGNNFANLGSATASPPGDYLMRPAGSRAPGLTMLDPASNNCSYQGIVDFATIYGSMEIRILLRNNGSDLDTVHRYQNETYTKSIPRNDTPLAPSLSTSLLGNGSLAPASYSGPFNLSYANATELLSLLAQLAPYNPPQNNSQTDEVNAMLSRAGIANGTYRNEPFNLSAVNEIILVNTTRELTPNPSTFNDFGNGWWQPGASESGEFHDAYIVRAIIAWIGYLQLVEEQVLYPVYYSPGSSGQNSLTLAANESFVFTFSSRPPAQFWSITIYGSDSYLIKNPLGRYDLGSTSTSLTYPNGSKVYPTGQNNSQYYNKPDAHEPFQLLIQASNQAPPANWTGNWIPSEAGGGSFSVNFRTYGPSPALSNGSCVFPVVTKEGVVV